MAGAGLEDCGKVEGVSRSDEENGLKELGIGGYTYFAVARPSR